MVSVYKFSIVFMCNIFLLKMVLHREQNFDSRTKKKKISFKNLGKKKKKDDSPPRLGNLTNKQPTCWQVTNTPEPPFGQPLRGDVQCHLKDENNHGRRTKQALAEARHRAGRPGRLCTGCPVLPANRKCPAVEDLSSGALGPQSRFRSHLCPSVALPSGPPSAWGLL